MRSYRRPSIPPVALVGADGQPIAYGSRWGSDSPSPDSYSVTSNLQRFAPVHAVADALIEWLQDTFDVITEDGPAGAEDLLRPRDDVIRAVRIRPCRETAATVTFIYTSFPSVIVHAGALHDFFFPVCGCDACDETWQTCADELEWTIRTVVHGGFGEQIRPGRELPVHFSLDEPNVGSRAGDSRAEDYPPARLRDAAAILSARSRWAAWPTLA